MKLIAIKTSLLLILLLLFSKIKAQYVNSGFEIKNDSIECLQNISVYKEFQKLKLFDKAIPVWEITYKTCKGFKKIIYQDGEKFLVYSIKKEKDLNKRKMLVDSLMHLYEERIKYFGQKGYVNGRQGINLFKYDKERFEEAHILLKSSFELQKNKTDAAIIVILMAATKDLWEKNKIQKEEFVNTYSSCIENIEYQLSKENNPKKVKGLNMALNAVDAVFGHGDLDCESLVAAFTTKYNSKKDDIEQVLKIQSILKGASCFNDSLYFDVSMQVQKLKPSAENAYLIARLFLEREEFKLTLNYLKKAIDLQSSDSLKAIYYNAMAVIKCHKLQQYQQARTDANKAISLRPNWGKPYILIGEAYAASSKLIGNNSFENASVFWAAVDKFYKAKTIDPQSEKTANTKIAYYSNYFPKSEETFFQGLSDGKKYTVGGWINESTIVRTRK